MSGVRKSAEGIFMFAGVFRPVTNTSAPSGFQPENVASSVDCSYVRILQCSPENN